MALNLDGTTGITSDNGTPVIENLNTTDTGIDITGQLTTTGNVGIGTSSPASRIHASYAGAVNTNTFNVSTTSVTSAPKTLIGANLVLSDDATTYTKPATAISGAGILFEGINSLNAHGSIQFLSAPDDNTGSAIPIERMRIDSDGRVTMPYKPWILCKVYRASASSGPYSLDAKASRFLSVGTYGGNHAILAPVEGVYAINFNGITSQNSGRQDINLYKNGGILLSSLNEANGDGYHYRSIATTQYLYAGDAIQMYHGASVTPYYTAATGSDLEWCNLTMTLLG